MLLLDVSPRLARRTRIAATCVFLPIFVMNQRGLANSAEWIADSRRAAIPALMTGIYDSGLLFYLYPSDPAHVLSRLPPLKSASLSIFVGDWSRWLGTRIADDVRLQSSAQCAGTFTLAEQVAHTNPIGWRAHGTAETNAQKPIQEIVLADGDGTIVGFGVHVHAFMVPAHVNNAWIGNFSANAVDSVRAYAIVDNGRGACPFGPAEKIEQRLGPLNSAG